MRASLIILFVSVLTGCTHNESRESSDYSSSDASYRILQYAEEETYGRTPENPILVGDGDLRNGPRNERNFLEALRGPNGENITYERLGSCCRFETPNGIMGGGLLDQYKVTYKGLDKPIFLYFNFYDKGDPKIPIGFTAK